MAYGRKYYKEFDGYNAATRQTYTVLVDIYEDGFAGSAIEIEEISASPLQLSLDSSGDPLYTAIKKTSAAFNIINTGQFDYSEFYTSNAKKYKMMITSTVFNWTGYLVPQAVSFDLATNGEFTLTASDGLHLLQSIDYKANENEMTTLAAFLTDIETKIGLSTFNRTSTVNTEYGDIWNSLIYKGMLVGKTYEEAFEMVLKAIGMQVRYWKITPIISIESALQTASVKCTNEYPELNFLAPIKTAKLNRNITTLPSAFKNALVDDASDLKPRAANSYNTLTNWTVVSDNGLVVFDIGANETDRKANKYKAINMFVKPTNATYDTQRLTGNEGSYFQLRPVQKTPFTLSFNANFGNISSWGRSSADGYRSYIHPVKWSSIKWGLYDSISNKSYSKTTNSWSITGTPTSATANELKVTDPADSFVDVYIPIPAPTGLTANLRFYLFTGAVEYVNAAPVGESRTNRLSISSIDIDGEYIVSENELYTAVNGAVAVGDNIDVLDYEVDFGSVPVPPLNTSLYYGSAFFDNNLNQLNNVIIGANTVSHEQYLFNTILYTQNEIRKKVYTANINMLTNVSPFWLKTTLKTDTVMVNACSFDFKTSRLNGEFTEIMPYVYREWAITSESEIGSSDWGGSGGTTGTSGGGGTVDTSNFVVKTGATDQAIEGIVRPDNLLSNGAVVAKSLAPTDVNEWPEAGTGVKGVVKYDGTTIALNANGQLTVIGGGSGGTSAWGTPTSQSVPLTVDSITRNLSLDGHTHSYLPLSGGNLTGALTISGNTVWHAGNDGAGSGLDAGLLCNRSDAGFLRVRYGFKNNINDQSLLNDNSTSYWTPTTIGIPNGGYGVLLSVSDETTWFNQIGFGTDNSIYFRQSINSSINFGAWRTLAFTDSNVASATKLATTRTIWGQNFNGEGNVDGLLVINKSSADASEGQQSLVILSGVNDSKLQMGAIPNVGSYIQSMRHGCDWTSRPLLLQPNGGNVGIGVNSPSYKLDVNGAIRSNYVLFKNYNDNGLAGYVGRGASNNNNLQFLAYTGNSVYIGANENEVSGITINTSNYVGIGTTSPQFKLDINGTSRIFGSLHLNSDGWLQLYNSNNTSTISLSHNNASSKLDIYNRTLGNWANVEAGFLTCDTITMKNNLSEKFIRSNAWGGAIRLRANSGAATDRGLQLGRVDNNLAFTSFMAFNGDSGNVSINSTADYGYKLDVNGTGRFTDSLSASRIFTGYDSGFAGSVSCSNWFRSNGATGWLNATYTAGILSDTANIVRTYSTNKFKVYNTSSDSIYTLGGVLSDGAIVAKYLSASYGVDWPVMTASVQGVAKAGSSMVVNAGTLDMRNRHYTTTTSYTDGAVRDITAEISIGTGSLLNTETMSLSLPFLPSSTTKSVTGNIVINPTTWAGTGLTVTFLNNGTNWVAFITNCSGATANKNGIKLSVQAKQTV